MKKIFDNIKWVIVLTTLLFLAIMAYLSNMRFNVNYKLDSMDKAFKSIVKQTDLDKKSPERNTSNLMKLYLTMIL